MKWLSLAVTIGLLAVDPGRCVIGTQYNGVPSRIVIPGALHISSMSGSGTNPTLITTSAPHGLTTGDAVDVSQVDGNTAANGTWPATVTSGVQISIPVTGNGTYTGVPGGTLTPLTFGSTFQIPSDGDLISGSNANVGPEALGDRTAMLIGATGAYKLVATGSIFHNDPTGVVQWATISSVGTGFTLATGAVPLVTLTGLQPNDIVDADLGFVASYSGGGQAFYGLAAAYNAPGAAALPFNKIVGSATGYAITGNFSQRIHGRIFMSLAGSEAISFGHQSNVAGAASTAAFGDALFRWWVLRPTGVNQ